MPVTGLLTGARGFGMFAAGPASDFVLIQSTTVGSGGASSVTFSNIPQGFRHLQVRATSRGNMTFSSGLSLYLRFNGDAGNNYAWHYLLGIGSSVLASALTSTSSIRCDGTVGDTTNSNVFGAAVIDIFDYADTSKNKVTRTLGGIDNNGAGAVGLRSGLWMSTTAVNSINVQSDASFLQHSTFSLYGIR